MFQNVETSIKYLYNVTSRRKEKQHKYNWCWMLQCVNTVSQDLLFIHTDNASDLSLFDVCK